MIATTSGSVMVAKKKERCTDNFDTLYPRELIVLNVKPNQQNANVFATVRDSEVKDSCFNAIF